MRDRKVRRDAAPVTSSNAALPPIDTVVAPDTLPARSRPFASAINASGLGAYPPSPSSSDPISSATATATGLPGAEVVVVAVTSAGVTPAGVTTAGVPTGVVAAPADGVPVAPPPATTGTGRPTAVPSVPRVAAVAAVATPAVAAATLSDRWGRWWWSPLPASVGLPPAAPAPAAASTSGRQSRCRRLSTSVALKLYASTRASSVSSPTTRPPTTLPSAVSSG